MWEQIFKWVSEHYPVLGIVIIVAVGSMYLTSRYFHWAHRVEKAEEKCSKIDGHIVPKLTEIDTTLHGMALSMNSSIGDINSSIGKMNTSFIGLVSHLQAKDIVKDLSLFISRSPFRLTQFGLQVLQRIGGDRYVDEHLDLLISEMDKQGIKTALDTQITAPIIIANAAEDISFKPIKDFIYSHPVFNGTNESGGTETVTLDLNKAAQVMGVYLRDKYLARHPELNPEDIPSLPLTS